MPRNIYGPEHEDFRASVSEFVERTLKPRAEQMLEVKAIDRDIWKEAGSQGLFGLDIPEEFGGMGTDDYRFAAVNSSISNPLNLDQSGQRAQWIAGGGWTIMPCWKPTVGAEPGGRAAAGIVTNCWPPGSRNETLRKP